MVMVMQLMKQFVSHAVCWKEILPSVCIWGFVIFTLKRQLNFKEYCVFYHIHKSVFDMQLMDRWMDDQRFCTLTSLWTNNGAAAGLCFAYRDVVCIVCHQKVKNVTGMQLNLIHSLC